jgi:hypothetical protein
MLRLKLLRPTKQRLLQQMPRTTTKNPLLDRPPIRRLPQIMARPLTGWSVRPLQRLVLKQIHPRKSLVMLPPRELQRPQQKSLARPPQRKPVKSPLTKVQVEKQRKPRQPQRKHLHPQARIQHPRPLPARSQPRIRRQRSHPPKMPPLLPPKSLLPMSQHPTQQQKKLQLKPALSKKHLVATLRLKRQHLQTRPPKIHPSKKSLPLETPLQLRKSLRLKKLLSPKLRRWKNRLPRK